MHVILYSVYNQGVAYFFFEREREREKYSERERERARERERGVRNTERWKEKCIQIGREIQTERWEEK